jgi:hypothetical protein
MAAGKLKLKLRGSFGHPGRNEDQVMNQTHDKLAEISTDL